VAKAQAIAADAALIAPGQNTDSTSFVSAFRVGWKSWKSNRGRGKKEKRPTASGQSNNS